MTKIQFPNSAKVYFQNNRSNVYPKGNLWGTFGMDFQSNVGVMRVAPRLKIVSQVSDLANLGTPVAFKFFSGRFWTVAGARVFYGGDSPEDAFTQDASTNTPTTCSSSTADLEVFDGKLWVTTQTGLLSNGSGGTNGDWTDRGMTLTTGLVHITRYFPQFNRLYVTNGTTILSINTALSVTTLGDDYTLSLPFGNLITSMEMTSDTIWIGTQSRDVANANGNMFEWDGISAQATNVYPLQAKAAMAIVINEKTDVPSVMDNNGIFREFNGQGFGEIGRLPFTNVLPLDDDGLNATNKYMHFNGLLYTPNDTFLALVDNRDENGNINENLPSGIWEWAKETNFVHKYPFTYSVVGGTTVTDWGQNRISLPGGLFNALLPSTSEADKNGILLAGAQINTNASSTTNAIFVDDTINTTQKKGYFVTDWFESAEIASSWNIWWMSYRKFLEATSSFTLKYRFTEEAPVEANITWVDTTHFTTATDISSYWTSGTGGEVEILQGVGSGLCAHITSITGPSGGLYTVTIDETATGATTTTAVARFQKWVKVEPAESLASPRNWAQFAIGGDSQPRVQVKGCFTFIGNGEFYKAILTSNEDIKT